MTRGIAVDLAQEGAQENAAHVWRGWGRRLGHWLGIQIAAERERWPLWLPVHMGAGIGLHFSLKSEPPVWIGPAALLLAALASGLAWRSERAWFPAAGCLAFALGFASAQFQAHDVAAPVLERRVAGTLEGRVFSVDPLPEGSRIVIAPASLGDLAPARLPARVRVRLRHGDGGVVPGDWVSLRVSVEPPPAPAMPGAYDFERAAWFLRLGGVGYALSAPEQTAPPAGAAPGEFGQALNALRQGRDLAHPRGAAQSRGRDRLGVDQRRNPRHTARGCGRFPRRGSGAHPGDRRPPHGHGGGNLLLRVARDLRAHSSDRAQLPDQEIRGRFGAWP